MKILISFVAILSLFNLFRMSPVLFSKKRYEQTMKEGREKTLKKQEEVQKSSGSLGEEFKINMESTAKKAIWVGFVAKCTFFIVTAWYVYNPNYLMATILAGVLTLACILDEVLKLRKLPNMTINDKPCNNGNRILSMVRFFVKVFYNATVLILLAFS